MNKMTPDSLNKTGYLQHSSAKIRKYMSYETNPEKKLGKKQKCDAEKKINEFFSTVQLLLTLPVRLAKLSG